MLAYKYLITNNFNGRNIYINAALDNDGACLTINGQPTGARLTVYPTFELDVRNEEIEKQGQHGIFDFFSFYGKRNITFTGTIIAESHSELVTIQNRIKEIFTLPSQPIAGTNDGYINIKWTDALGEDWEIDAKIQQDIQFSRQVGVQTEASFFINLKADNPLILSQEEFQQDSLLGWRGSKFTVPAFLPNNINFIFHNDINIYQAGSADAPWKANLYGPGTNPKITRFFENFTNEELISDFTSGWTGGEDDTVNFQTDGLARKLVSTAGAQEVMNLPGAIDLSGGAFITCYFYVDDASNLEPGDYLTGQNYIKFIENAGVDEFVIDIYQGNKTIRSGWNYFYFLRDQFEQIGNPSWNDITDIELSVKATAGNNVEVTFDSLKIRDITYTESKLEAGITLGAGEFLEVDIAEGTVLKNGTQDVSGFVTLDSSFFNLLPKQNIVVYESDESPPLSWVYPTQLFEFFWNNAQL